MADHPPVAESVTVSIPDPLGKWVKDAAVQSGFRTPDDYVKQLIRAEQDRQAEQELYKALMEGVNSGPPIPGDETWLASQHARLAEHRVRKASGS